MTTHGLTPFIVSNESLLRAMRDGGHATGKALAEAAGIHPNHVNRQISLLKEAGLAAVTEGDPAHMAELTEAAMTALAALDRAAGGHKRRGQASVGRFRANPHNPRKIDMDDPHTAEDIAGLAASYAGGRGILQRLRVTPPDADGIMTILIGERRWRGAGLVDPALDIQLPYDIDLDPRATDPTTAAAYAAELALVENGQRADLSIMEEARAMLTMLDGDPSLKGSARALAKRLKDLDGREFDSWSRIVQQRIKVAREATPEDIAFFERGYGPDGEAYGWKDLLASVQDEKVEAPAGPADGAADVAKAEAEGRYYNGQIWPNATMASEARRIAEGGGGYNSGSSSTPKRDTFSEQVRESARDLAEEQRKPAVPQPSEEPPLTLASLEPKVRLAFLEFAHKLHHQGSEIEGHAGRSVKVHEYWTKPSFLTLAGHKLVGVMGTDAYLLGRGAELLPSAGATPEAMDALLADARFEAGLNAPAEGEYSTDWLNVPERAADEVESADVDTITQRETETLDLAWAATRAPADQVPAAIWRAWAALGIAGPIIVSSNPLDTGVLFDEATGLIVFVVDREKALSDEIAQARAIVIAQAANLGLCRARDAFDQAEAEASTPSCSEAEPSDRAKQK